MDIKFGQVALVAMLAAMSPGPDLLMVARNSLLHGRKSGVACACGLGMGILLHCSYCIAGLAVLLVQHPAVVDGVRCAGGLYLLYLGVTNLRHSRTTLSLPSAEKVRCMPLRAAVFSGMFSNLLNPKAGLFVVGVFTAFAHADMRVQTLYAVELAVAAVTWFSFLATMISYERIRLRVLAVQTPLNRVFGILLIGVGLGIAMPSF